MGEVYRPPRGFFAPRFSPRGDRFVVVVREGTGSDPWIGDLEGSLQPLTTDGRSRAAIWNPMGTEVAYESLRETQPKLVVQAVERSEPVRPIYAGPSYPASWLKDGRLLVGAYNQRDRPGLDEPRLLASPGSSLSSLAH